MTTRRQKFVALPVAIAIMAFAAAAIPSVRHSGLQALGWTLVAQDPIIPADIIVISIDAGGAGALEAADLVKSGIASRVAVFTDPPSGDDLEFIRRGLPYDDASARQIRQLDLLGVKDVIQIPRPSPGTNGEGAALSKWTKTNVPYSIVLVASRDHSRRMRRVINRAMQGRPIRVAIQPARHSTFDPDKWWETRIGTRIAIVELQKLLLDVAAHPLSF